MYACPYELLYLGKDPECSLIRRGKRANWRSVINLEIKGKNPLWRTCYTCFLIHLYDRIPEKDAIEEILNQLIDSADEETIVVDKVALKEIFEIVTNKIEMVHFERSLLDSDLLFSIFADSILWETSSALKKIFSIRKKTAVVILILVGVTAVTLMQQDYPIAAIAIVEIIDRLFSLDDNTDYQTAGEREILRILSYGNYTENEITQRANLRRNYVRSYLRILEERKLVEKKGRVGNVPAYGLKSSSLARHYRE